MIVPRQDKIVEELKKRINDGFYTDKLPSSALLAEEFDVNIKTLNKAMARLVRMGLLERRRHAGTTVKHKQDGVRQHTIEIIYKGFQNAFQHPFWSQIIFGIIKELEHSNCHPLLSPLKISQPLTEQLEKYHPLPCSGRIVLGVHDVRFFSRLNNEPEPCISAGDFIPLPRFPQVAVSCVKAAEKTIDLMCRNGFKRIAFLGCRQIFEEDDSLEKFRAWRDTIRRYMPLDPDLAVPTDPLPGFGKQSTELLLSRKIAPDAICTAFGTHYQEIKSTLQKAGLDIPVISFDGLLSGNDYDFPQPIELPLAECGQTAARTLVKMLSDGQKSPSIVLEAIWHPEFVPVKKN